MSNVLSEAKNNKLLALGRPRRPCGETSKGPGCAGGPPYLPESGSKSECGRWGHGDGERRQNRPRRSTSTSTDWPQVGRLQKPHSIPAIHSCFRACSSNLCHG